jgi:nucleotide-binding universal stress UspA family protein
MYKHILVPTDGSQLSAKAVKEACRLAKTCGSKVTVLHVMPDLHAYISEHYQVPPKLAAPVEKKYRQETAARSSRIVEAALAEAIMADIECAGASVTDDAPYRAIIKLAAKSKCDLIVMASHGRKGLKGFLLGSETTKVLVHSGISVLVVR